VNQYELQAVPLNERRGGFSLTVNWAAYVAVVVDLLVGAALGSSMPLSSAIPAIIIGNVMLMAVAATTSYLSFREGKSFALLIQKTFGANAAVYLTAFIAFVILGWFSIQTSLFAHFIALKTARGPVAESIIGAFLCAAMALPAYLGIDAIRKLSAYAVPVLALLCIWTWLSVPSVPDTIKIGQPLTLLAAIAVVIGTWIVGATTTVGDIFRFSRSARTAILGAMLGLGSDLILMSLGAIAVHRYGSGDLAEVLARSVGLWIGILFFAVDVWSTNDNAMYSLGLNVSVASKLRHKTAVVIGTTLAVIAVTFRPYRYEIIIAWLQFLGKVVPPIGATVIVSAFFPKFWNRDSRSRRTICLCLGSFFVGLTTAFFLHVGIGPLNGFLAAGVSQFILIKTTLRRNEDSSLARGAV
jgi:cytosine permease